MNEEDVIFQHEDSAASRLIVEKTLAPVVKGYVDDLPQFEEEPCLYIDGGWDGCNLPKSEVPKLIEALQKYMED